MMFICENVVCKSQFKSKHSVARFCSRKCAGQYNHKTNSNFINKSINKYSDEQLLNFIRQWVEENGDVPSTRDFNRSEIYPSEQTYARRFGSWVSAIKLAGYNAKTKYPDSFFVNERNKVSSTLRFAVLKRDGFRCTYCGGTPSEGYILHVDHVKPVSRGGKTIINNLTTACVICNNGKSANMV